MDEIDVVRCGTMTPGYLEPWKMRCQVCRHGPHHAKITLCLSRGLKKVLWRKKNLDVQDCRDSFARASLFLVCQSLFTVNMATKLPYKTTFEPERVIQPIFTGGSVALDNGARILATTLGEDAVLTDLHNGKHYAKIEGVSVVTHCYFPVLANMESRTGSPSLH